MSRNWRHNADGLEDEKQREAQYKTRSLPEFLPVCSRSTTVFSVKELMSKASEFLTGEGHAGNAHDGQAVAVEIKPNLVRALIQRGALR